MNWTKDQMVAVVEPEMEKGSFWVYIEGKVDDSGEQDLLEKGDLSKIFLNSGAVLANGNHGQVVGFDAKSKDAADDFAKRYKSKPDIVALDGPNLV